MQVQVANGSVTRRDALSGLTGEAPTVRASQVQPQPIEWLWPERIPLGALTVLAGMPGLGKSLLTVRLVADLTAGRLGERAGDALLLSAEDARAQVVVPRLHAAGADLDRVHFDEIDQDGLRRQLVLPDDAGLIAQIVHDNDVRLVVIDPLTAHLGRGVDSWKDQSVRRALAPVAQLAEDSQAAVLVVAHLNKGQGSDPLQRLGGSIGLAAAARSVLLLGRDPDDPAGADAGSRRVLAHVKSNLGQQTTSLLYEIEPVTHAGAPTARISERGTSSYSGQELLAPADPAPAGATAEAIRFLQAELAHGPQPAKTLQAAAEQAGLSWDTVKKAKPKAGIESTKQKGINGQWVWTLTTRAQTEAPAA